MADNAFTQLFGDTLLSKDGDIATAKALDGKKTVAIYFSAHWCPPCRGFTLALAKAYTEHLKAKGLEVVFASSDRDQEAFDSYYGEQPWLALPFSNRGAKEALSKKFKVQGIPTLVILDGATGELITKDGRAKVSQDPEGKGLPWRPPTLWEALGDEFLSGTDGETVEIDEVRASAKVLGLYFSAHWCGPCRSFTPELAKAYTEHLKAKGLEIVFVSSDRDQASFLEYYKEQPWLAIPQGDERKAKLSELFEVRGIPTLVLIDAKTGKTITTDARSAVGADPTGEEFPYHPKPLVDMVTGDVGEINDEVALCAMVEGCDEKTQAKAVAALTPIAEASAAAADAGADRTLFFIAKSTGGPTSQIRKIAKLGEPSGSAQLLLLDIPDNGGYYTSDATEVTAEAVNTFLAEYKAGKLERQQLGG